MRGADTGLVDCMRWGGIQ